MKTNFTSEDNYPAIVTHEGVVTLVYTGSILSRKRHAPLQVEDTVGADTQAQKDPQSPCTL